MVGVAEKDEETKGLVMNSWAPPLSFGILADESVGSSWSRSASV